MASSSSDNLSNLSMPKTSFYTKLRQSLISIDHLDTSGNSLKTIEPRRMQSYQRNQQNLMNIIIKKKKSAKGKTDRIKEILKKVPELHEIVDSDNNNIYHHSIYNTDSKLLKYLKKSRINMNTVKVNNHSGSEINFQTRMSRVLPYTFNNRGKTPLDVFNDILFEVNTYNFYLENLSDYNRNYMSTPPPHTGGSRRARLMVNTAREDNRLKSLNNIKRTREVIRTREVFSTKPENSNFPITQELKYFRNKVINVRESDTLNIGRLLNLGEKFLENIHLLNPAKTFRGPVTIREYLPSTGVLPLRFLTSQNISKIVSSQGNLGISPKAFHRILQETDPRI